MQCRRAVRTATLGLALLCTVRLAGVLAAEGTVADDAAASDALGPSWRLCRVRVTTMLNAPGDRRVLDE